METISRTLLTFLLNALWQVPIAWAVAALACRVMPNGPARHRHVIWVAALWAAFLLPALSVCVPRNTALEISEPAPVAAVATASPSAGRTTTRPAEQAATTPNNSGIAVPRNWAMLLLGFYALWVAYRAVQFLRAWYRAWQICRNASPRGLDTVLDRCQLAFHIRGVRLLRSIDVHGPVALHRSILLPEAMFNESSEDVLAAAVGHEMAHIARRDFALKLLYEMIYLPLSFHPAAFLIHRGIERSREMACDELVTRNLLEPAVYARSIVAIAGSAAPLAQPGYVLGVFDGDILEERIRSLMERRGGDLRRARIALAGALSALALCLVFASGLAVSGYAQSAADPEMRIAADAFNRGDYASAAAHFEAAVKLDPANIKARLFLATALRRQNVAEGHYSVDESVQPPLLKAAESNYREVLELDPRNAAAMFGIVALNGPSRRSESREMMLKLISIDPANKDAYYTLGVIDWGIAYAEMREALKTLGAPPDVHQVPDAGIRAKLRTQLMPYLEEGYRMLQIALDKDPTSDNVPAYFNLLHRLHGVIAEEPESSSQLAQADEWVGKALAARRAKGPQSKIPPQIDLAAEPPVIVLPPPPPPPPPPPGSAPKPPNPAEIRR
jgi:beta-lactamase regulating signal transducer with metallopeptidase domain